MTAVPTLRVAGVRATISMRSLPFYERGLGCVVLYRFESTTTASTGSSSGAKGRLTISSSPGRTGTPPGARRRSTIWSCSISPTRTNGTPRSGGCTMRASRRFRRSIPLWDRDGVTFEDPDGYRIVFQRAAWTR